MGNNACSQMCSPPLNSKSVGSTEFRYHLDPSLGLPTATDTLPTLSEQSRKSMTQLNAKSKSIVLHNRERKLDTHETKDLKSKATLSFIGSVSDTELNVRTIEGFGVFMSKDGAKYAGNWKNGEKHGFGEEESPNRRSRFEGNFSSNLKNGFGKYTWPDGSFYEGIWKAGLKDGKGKQVNADGYEYDGQWKDGKKDGYGVFKNSEGEIYSGEFKDDLPNGAGTYTNKDEITLKGFWVKGKFENEPHCPEFQFALNSCSPLLPLIEYLLTQSCQPEKTSVKFIV